AVPAGADRPARAAGPGLVGGPQAPLQRAASGCRAAVRRGAGGLRLRLRTAGPGRTQRRDPDELVGDAVFGPARLVHTPRRLRPVVARGHGHDAVRPGQAPGPGRDGAPPEAAGIALGSGDGLQGSADRRAATVWVGVADGVAVLRRAATGRHRPGRRRGRTTGVSPPHRRVLCTGVAGRVEATIVGAPALAADAVAARVRSGPPGLRGAGEVLPGDAAAPAGPVCAGDARPGACNGRIGPLG